MDHEATTWHQALVFAVTGEKLPALGRQREPDVAAVVEAVGDSARGAHRVPVDLTQGIEPARFAAVLAAVRTRLAATTVRPVLTDRAPDAGRRTAPPLKAGTPGTAEPAIRPGGRGPATGRRCSA